MLVHATERRSVDGGAVCISSLKRLIAELSVSIHSSSRLILNYYYYVFQNKNKHYVLAVFSTSLTIYKSFASRFLSQPITVWRRSRVVQPPVLCVLCLLRSWNIVFTTAGQPDCGRAPHSLLVVTVQLSKVTERIGWRRTCPTCSHVDVRTSNYSSSELK